MSDRARACAEEAAKALLLAIEDVCFFGCMAALCLGFALYDGGSWLARKVVP